MLIDHTGAILFPGNWTFRYIGRLAFPIFCFLLVEGVCHTHNIRLYMLRLGAFALISEIPYDLAFHGKILEFEGQNVFFTLFLGVLLLYVLEKSSEWPVKAVEVLLVMWVAVVMKTDYSFKGILLISMFYFFRGFLAYDLAGAAVWNFLWNNRIQEYGVFAVIPIALYNGERGKPMKYFFYAFYPMHLLVLFVMQRFLGGLL